MSNNTDRRQPPSGEFDHTRPPVTVYIRGPDGEVPADAYQHGPLSRQPIKSNDHGGKRGEV
jgi:hypothetical protein